MFNKNPGFDRIREWADFRKTLETSDDPIKDTIDFYKDAPMVSIACDPYSQHTWPTPWDLTEENIYCNFSIILGISYTLQLTDRFKDLLFEIYICTDKEKSEVKYLLHVDKNLIGYHNDCAIQADMLPTNLKIEKQFILPKL